MDKLRNTILFIGVAAIITYMSGCVSQKEYAQTKTDLIEAKATLTAMKEENLENSKRSYDFETVLRKQDEQLMQMEDRINTLSKQLSNKQELLEQVSKDITTAILNYDAGEMPMAIRDSKVYLLLPERLLYTSGSADIENKGKEILHQVSQVLLQNPAMHVTIEGHTDNVEVVDTYVDNWELSTERALSVARYLMNVEGIPGQQLTVAGQGSSQPWVPNDSVNGRALNRRTVFIIDPDLEEIIETVAEAQ